MTMIAAAHRSHLIVGVQGQGKTTLALTLALHLRESTVAFDPNAQFPSEFRCRVDEVDSRLEAGEALSVVVPHPSCTGEIWRNLLDVLEGWSDYCLLVDESSILQRAGSCDPGLEAMLRFCRQRDVTVIQTTHRIVDLVKVSRTLATDVWCFRLGMRADLDMLGADFPFFPVQKVLDLQRYQVLHYWLGEDGRYHYSLWPGDRWAIAGIAGAVGCARGAGPGASRAKGGVRR